MKAKKISQCNYETDDISVEAVPYPRWGAVLDDGQINLDAAGEGVGFNMYLDKNIDPDRNAILTCVFHRVDAGADTLNMNGGLTTYMTDGTLDTTSILNGVITWNGCAADRYEKYQYTITTGLAAEKFLRGYFQLNEAAKEVKIKTISLRYFIKRSTP